MKLSVLFFFRRIFFVQESFCRFNITMIASTIAWGLAFMLAEILVCGANPGALWDLSTGSRDHCVNQSWLNLMFSVTDVIGDILIMAMPYPYIRKLNISLREKLGIASIFLLGTLSTIACIVRLGFISKAFTFDFGSDANHHGEGTPPAV